VAAVVAAAVVAVVVGPVRIGGGFQVQDGGGRQQLPKAGHGGMDLGDFFKHVARVVLSLHAGAYLLKRVMTVDGMVLPLSHIAQSLTKASNAAPDLVSFR
jgi:hypothetical protein